MKKNSLLLGIILSIGFISCDNNSLFDKYISVGDSWQKENVVEFNIDAPDTLNAYNLFLNLRSNNNYPYNNIFLIVSTEEPKGETQVDTLEYLMAKPDGTLLGKGFTDTKESKLWFKNNFKFKQLGNHTIRIKHAVRDRQDINGTSNLNGITEVGLRIETIE